MTIEQYKSLEMLDKYFKETPKEEVEAEIDLISNLDIRNFALSIYGVGVTLPEHECKYYVNADWTYLSCECGKRITPEKGN